MKPASSDHILACPVAFTASDGQSYTIHPLTADLAKKAAPTVLRIHNLIPYVQWSRDDLKREHRADGTPYRERWRLGFVVKDGDKIVGILLAYMRSWSDSHPMVGIYVHRLAVSESYQRRGIGTALLAFAIAAYFRAASWLLTVSVQTNDEPRNAHVIRIYKQLNLQAAYRIRYPDKTDLLLEVTRADHLAGGFPIPGREGLIVPKLSAPFIKSLQDVFFGRNLQSPAIVHFGTGSREKREQYRYLLRCYGLELMPLTTRISLAEPQVEGAGVDAESHLVTAPLKLYSRFAARTDTYPVVVEDTMLFIEHFNNDYAAAPILPGADTKRWWRTLGIQGLLRVMRGSDLRRAAYVCQLGVAYRNSRYEYFRYSLPGVIAEAEHFCAEAKNNFPYTNATFFHSLFVPDGSEKTLAEMNSSEFVQFDYRRKCLEGAVAALHAAASGEEQPTLFTLPDSGRH